MHFRVDDLRIQQIKPLIPPAILMEEIPLGETAQRTVAESRKSIENIMDGRDKRLLVIIGPCSIHDTAAAREYGKLLSAARQRFSDSLEIVMRVYFEKPRTRKGWKGLINDPYLDDSFQINKGLHLARKLLVDLGEMELPVGCEFLDTITPQFLADAVSWGAIGARTTESQIHRELASGLSMPVGFKNGTDGNVKIAIDAIHASASPHHFLSVTKQSVAAIVETGGNDYAHLILRGGNDGPNYDQKSIADACGILKEDDLTPRVMVDCSHGNSMKDHRKQVPAVRDLAKQIAGGTENIFGLMIESNLVEGKQPMAVLDQLKYGQSVTDACLGWDDSLGLLEELAQASLQRMEG
ncbi:3-deoxy-7-phosphoheptulonate synthase [Salinispira pacifica]|uniref:Phospho-2-dehydro-3-deoxyheptonate aldolase n=1 Tax=Salinispira pacifica TaxID=1307761 RepID=V5WDJ9_9SPIO|nr:3-deoxy-7-phosphoheptulonate synthase [Salinispira pacifica]AHC13862.1 2-keto-3-deoxy-D-arabino-heptulosonate-7- phosphate synthase I alpha [Salinispira pacifica]